MKRLRSIASFLAAFLLTAALVEILLSSGGVLEPIITIDPDKGERYVPDKMFCSLFVTEGFGLAKVNRNGWFGKEFSDKGANDISVAVMGNSFIASRQVFYRDNFLSIAESELNLKQKKLSFSFYNFGKEDMPLKELLYVKNEIASTYNPDYILIFLNSENFYSRQRYVPYFELINDSLQLNTSFSKSAFVKKFNKIGYLTRLSVFFLAHRVKNRLPDAGRIFLDKFYFSDEEDKGLDIMHTDFTVTDIDKAVIKELDNDKRVVFLMDIDPSKKYKVASLIGNVPVIDIKPSLIKMKEEKKIDPYYWPITRQYGHWNHAAHKVIGGEIARGMVEIILKDSLMNKKRAF